MYIVLAANHTAGSWLLRACMWSRWSHSAVYDEDEGLVYDTTLLQGGVCCTHWDAWAAKYPKRELRPLTVRDPAKARDWLAEQLGKPYDWTALVGFVLRRGGWDADDSWFCSELTEAFRSRFSAPRFRAQVARVTPAHQDMLVD